MKADGVERAIAFSQYPQWSCTTTGSSMNHLWRELDRLNMTNDFKWSLIDRWNTHPGYIDAVAQRVRMGLAQFAPEDRDKVIIMFSAHSIPMKTVYKGDPYVKEIASTSEHVMKALGLPNSHILSWQSKGTTRTMVFIPIRPQMLTGVVYHLNSRVSAVDGPKHEQHDRGLWQTGPQARPGRAHRLHVRPH
jgi:ferrochelatase